MLPLKIYSPHCKSFEINIHFSLLVIRGFIKGLEIDYPFFFILWIKIAYFVIIVCKNQNSKSFKIIFHFSQLLIRGLIQELKTD